MEAAQEAINAANGKKAIPQHSFSGSVEHNNFLQQPPPRYMEKANKYPEDQ